ncbi:MAG: DUF4440 domain-containing protein [Sphingobium sp.]|nr:DUF4440 domain-containing protein [Sphingobium sp.]
MTRVVSAILLSGLAFAGLSACTSASSAADPKADVDAIKAVEDGMRAAYKAKDPARLAALYASDATIYIPNEIRPRVGTQAIMEGARTDMADPGFSLIFTTGKVAVSSAGDTGYSKGSFTARYTDPKTKSAAGFSGFYLTLFAKQKDGSWKAIEDMATPAG